MSENVETVTAPAPVQSLREVVPIESIRPHPRNYRNHPDDQLAHITASIMRYGIYRDIVVAKDGTILAGHGVAKAAKAMGVPNVPVIRLELDADDPAALKLLAGDNEIARRAEQDDRLLTEILRDVKNDDLAGLMGTGYDEKMLANLVFITRPQSEIATVDDALRWVGMPAFDAGMASDARPRLIVSFDNEADRDAFMQLIGNPTRHAKAGRVWSVWWPDRPREQLLTQGYKEKGAPAAETPVDGNGNGEAKP